MRKAIGILVSLLGLVAGGISMYFAFTGVGQPFDEVATKVYGWMAVFAVLSFIGGGIITSADAKSLREPKKRTVTKHISSFYHL